MTPTTDAPVTVGREYRKTATIRAVQWWKMGDHPAVVMASDVIGATPEKPLPFCPTLEGGHVVTPGDWIATGVQGEHWPIKPDVFAATYRPVEPVMDFGEAIDPNASHNRRRSRHRLAALASAPAGGGVAKLAPSDRTRMQLSAIVIKHTVVGGYPDTHSIAHAAYDLGLAASLDRPRAAVGEREAWELPDLRDLHRDIERVRNHDLGNDRMRDLLRGAMDMLKAADVEYAALQSPPAKDTE